MPVLTQYPLVILVITFVGLWLSEVFGNRVLKSRRDLDAGSRDDFGIVATGTLTLLALLIGFSFSMATTRYDQRKSLEEAEANAIGTEYVRADLLPPDDGAKLRPLLRAYLRQRIAFYDTRDREEVRQANAGTARLQNELWSSLRAPAAANPTPVMALVISGMNDVLNSQGYTQAAWWNTIPREAWILMAAIGICSSVLVGYGARPGRAMGYLLMVLPGVVSVAFYLIAELDSPRTGLIRVHPQNLISLAESFEPRVPYRPGAER